MKPSIFAKRCVLIVAAAITSAALAQGNTDTISLPDPAAIPDSKPSPDASQTPSPASDGSDTSSPAPGALPGVPSGTTTPYIPVVVTPGGTQVGVSANVDTSGPNPVVNGGGIGVSTPVSKNTSVGAGVSNTPSGNSVGVGVSVSF